MKKFTGIKSWAEDDRPREKLMQKGRSALSDAELLSIMLGSGNQNQNALELAKEILSDAEHNLSNLSKQSWEHFSKFQGVGSAKAAKLVAAFELGRRRQGYNKSNETRITNSNMVFEHMGGYFVDMVHEEFHVLLLDRANHVIRRVQVSIGGMSGTVADGKIIFKKAIDVGAHAIILIHNHPSGHLTPSTKDIQLTRRLVQFGQYIDLPVIDHVIFSENGYFSFADSGLLES
jgi:DNA repair protein RadC